MEALRGTSLHATALTMARHLFGDELEPAVLDQVVRSALDFAIPLVSFDTRVHVLELFHGPTLAFKDVGARFMARLMAAFHGDVQRTLTVLVATSGDTGSAVAHAFYDLPGTRVVVLYPAGRVSRTQEHQFATLGGNVQALAVSGTFDDCQRLAREVLADASLRERVLLTSANSINVGRLLPQIFYYFHAWAQLPEPPDELIVSVPSGNFGNLTAGVMAKRLGLPVTRLVAATNVNDVVPQYLASGRFEPRPSIATLSSAMDVGNPSNFARLLALYEGDWERMRTDVTGAAFGDPQTRAAIRQGFTGHGYVLDPHSAVAALGLAAAMAERPGATGVFLATAHPAKFADVVEPLIGRPVDVPERLRRCLERQPQVTQIGARLEELREVLLPQ